MIIKVLFYYLSGVYDISIIPRYQAVILLLYPSHSLSFPVPSLLFPIFQLSFPVPSLSFPRRRESGSFHINNVIYKIRITLLNPYSTNNLILADKTRSPPPRGWQRASAVITLYIFCINNYVIILQYSKYTDSPAHYHSHPSLLSFPARAGIWFYKS